MKPGSGEAIRPGLHRAHRDVGSVDPEVNADVVIRRAVVVANRQAVRAVGTGETPPGAAARHPVGRCLLPPAQCAPHPASPL